jgi:hypothetical protein
MDGPRWQHAFVDPCRVHLLIPRVVIVTVERDAQCRLKRLPPIGDLCRYDEMRGDTPKLFPKIP